MSDAVTLRALAKRLPSVEEHTHFRLPAFRVGDKVFAVIQNPDSHAVLHVGLHDAEAAVARNSAACELVWRGEHLVGVRVELSAVTDPELGGLVSAAWRHRAPRKLAAAFDDEPPR